jgi:DNA-binding GntR family transcriptional regulator
MVKTQILPEIHTESLAIQIYGIIRQQIANGDLRPGERLSEGKFTRQLSISRTPVREALLKLEKDGLVICSSRRSYNVRILAVSDVLGIYQTLGILESAGVTLAAERITPEDIRVLKQYNQEMERDASTADLAAFGHRNHKFHNIFLAKIDNQILLEVCNSVRALLYIFPVRRKSLTEWLTKSVCEHREIIRLTEAGDIKALESYFRNVHWDPKSNLQYMEDAFE